MCALYFVYSLAQYGQIWLLNYKNSNSMSTRTHHSEQHFLKSFGTKDGIHPLHLHFFRVCDNERSSTLSLRNHWRHRSAKRFQLLLLPTLCSRTHRWAMGGDVTSCRSGKRMLGVKKNRSIAFLSLLFDPVTGFGNCYCCPSRRAFPLVLTFRAVCDGNAGPKIL